MNYTLVGIFVVVLAAVLTAGVLWLASGGAMRKHYDRFLAIEEESVAGLSVNAPVKYNGVDVGRIRIIALDPRNPQRVRLTLDIERGTPIKQDTLAVLKVQGLTGIAYIELSGGARNAPPLAVTPGELYPVIRTKPSLSARLETVLTTALLRLDHLSATVDAVFSDANRTAFSNTLANLAEVTHTLAQRKDSIDTGLRDAAKTFQNTAHITANLDPLIARIGRSAEAVEKLGNQGAEASQHASKALDNLDGTVQRFNGDTAPALQSLLGELNALSTSLRRLSEQTERNPAEFLRGRSTVPEGPGEIVKGNAP